MSDRCYIFDIDGTLANNAHRIHHLRLRSPNYRAYYAAARGDAPVPHIVELARHLSKHAPVIFATTRSDLGRPETEGWLCEHLGVSVDARSLFMRRHGDEQDDGTIKIQLLAKIMAAGWEPIMAFDDRDVAVAAWRRAGIPCAQVVGGNP